jgi:hypothetical protein
MKNINDNLSEILDVTPIDLEKDKIIDDKITSIDNIENDADFARQNIRTLIEKGNSAINDLLSVAKASEHPRAYEVAAGLLKNLTDMNKDLLEIQKRKKDLEIKQTSNQNSINVDKAVFIGSTKELIKALKNKEE